MWWRLVARSTDLRRRAGRLYHAAPTTFGQLPPPPARSPFQLPAAEIPPKWQPPSWWLRLATRLGLAAESTNDAARAQLVNAYRRYGFLRADLDPLGLKTIPDVPELSPELYGLDEAAELRTTSSGDRLTVGDLRAQLERLYCGPITSEFVHINNAEERAWWAQNYERTVVDELTDEERVKLADLMTRCQNFDRFLAWKFPQVKRYGGEGAESMMGFFAELFDTAPAQDVQQIVVCMAHRGRLNLLTELMQFPVVQMFRKMRGKPEFPADVQGSGDVLSHFVSSFDHATPDGKVHVTMLPNPSHLEAVNPVAVGKARARARSLSLGDYATGDAARREARPGDGVLCLQVHGDGAFTGQGVVWETLLLSQVPHFRVGGSIHLVTNNQVAFTAEAHIGRSSTHTTDIAKALQAPIVHVNADHPEEVVKAARLALAYRQKFRKDVFVNLICFRRHGHNELDDPKFTQPRMYSAIESRPSIPDTYAEELSEEGKWSEEKKKAVEKEHTDRLLAELAKTDNEAPFTTHLRAQWSGIKQAPAAVERWDTGVDLDQLRFIGAASVKTPDSFNVHPHLQKTHVQARLAKITAGEGLDWSSAEALAIGSLLSEGVDVRISGQDVGRGTFSHRHAMLVDQKTDESFVPLNSIRSDQKGMLEVANNPLSEEAVLGFEWGFASEAPNRLVVWEAQFGDFFNGAQIIIDTFIASAESKWLLQSGLVMLLPHGYDGAGPEHSNCRMERFLQLCDSREDQKPVDGENVNMRVVNPTTSAQYFHLLRRQVLPPYRKPLVVVAPKILLRHPKAASSLADIAPGTHFRPVLDDPRNDKGNVRKVILVSGKHHVTVSQAAQERGVSDLAVIRLEQLCPFPVAELRDVLSAYPNASKFVWSQEEPRNSGAWSFVRPRLAAALGIDAIYAGRPELAWTATAIGEHHAKEATKLLDDTFAA